MKNPFFLLLFFALFGNVVCLAQPLPKNWRAKHWRDIGPYTYNLHDIDVVELHLFEAAAAKLEVVDPASLKIIDTKRFTGAEAQRIAQLWRDQDWRGFGAACHEPVYGITFYRRGRKLFFGSICFGCMNVYIYAAKSEVAGFDREDRAYPRLRSLFKDIWGK